MTKRIRLRDRVLPDYTLGEEIVNTVTHALGGGLAVQALIMCVLKTARMHGALQVTAVSVYGGCLVALYLASAVYHGFHPCMAKKVFQILDHCAIYLLIAGTYTGVSLTALRQIDPWLGWGMVAFQWILASVAVTLTAIDLKAYEVFSMVCYIGMGWAILPFMGKVWDALGSGGFLLLLSGGIAYTVGAVLYGVGAKVRWMHSVFHVLVLLGSVLHFLSIYLYAI